MDYFEPYISGVQPFQNTLHPASEAREYYGNVIEVIVLKLTANVAILPGLLTLTLTDKE